MFFAYVIICGLGSPTGGSDCQGFMNREAIESYEQCLAENAAAVSSIMPQLPPGAYPKRVDCISMELSY